MGESKDYVSRSDELGNIHISEEVLAAISAAAALEVEGVSSLTANPSKKNAAKGVHVKLEEEKVVPSPWAGRGGSGCEHRHRVHERTGSLRRQYQCGGYRLPAEGAVKLCILGSMKKRLQFQT